MVQPDAELIGVADEGLCAQKSERAMIRGGIELQQIRAIQACQQLSPLAGRIRDSGENKS